MINHHILHPYGPKKKLWGLTLTIWGGGGGGENGPAHFFPTLENKEIAKYLLGLCYYNCMSIQPLLHP